MINANFVKELREVSGAGMMDCKKALEASAGDMDKAIDWLREKGLATASKKESRIAAEGLANIFVDGNKAIIIEVNSETDFVAKNEEFKQMIETIGLAILKSDARTVEDALNLNLDGENVNSLIVNKTLKIGEKLSLRRFEVLVKTDEEVFGPYIHLGGKIAVLTLLGGTNEEVAKDVAMQSAAMRPLYIFEEEIPSSVVEHEQEILKIEAMNEGKSEEIAEKMVEGRLKKYFKEICLAEQPFIKDSDITVKAYVEKNNCVIKKMIRYEVGEGMEKRSDDFASEVMKQVNKA